MSAVESKNFQPGDRVRVKEGTFEKFEGAVDSVDVVMGKVILIIVIFGRPTPLELETWQIEAV